MPLLEIFLLMLAVVVLYRFYRVLGRRTGHQPPPTDMSQNRSANTDTVVPMPERPRSAEPKSSQDDDLDRPTESTAKRPSGTAGLTQIRAADPEFETSEFLEGARAAFEIILTAFANGDKRQLKPLLGDSVFSSFGREIERREEANERQETTLVSIVLADIVGAKLEDRVATVTVKIVSEQVNVRTNADGDVVDGDPDHVVTLTDVWSFQRDTGSRDPNWQLVETRTEG